MATGYGCGVTPDTRDPRYRIESRALCASRGQIRSDRNITGAKQTRLAGPPTTPSSLPDPPALRALSTVQTSSAELSPPHVLLPGIRTRALRGRDDPVGDKSTCPTSRRAPASLSNGQSGSGRHTDMSRPTNELRARTEATVLTTKAWRTTSTTS